MTTVSCADARLSLGAYVVGSLNATERAELEGHLDTCPACRDELAEFAGLPGLLARVDVADVVNGEPSAPPELLDRVLRAASFERRSERRWRVLAAAAVVAVASAGAAAAAAQIAESGNSTPRPAAVAQVLTATDPASHVSARITTQPQAWGTAVRVQLAGVPQGETCSLVVANRNGKHEVAATWKVNYTGAVDVAGATAWAPSDITSYAVVTDEGQQLVSVPAVSA
jgi:predicted anti-sigma-YlaC factor YlaD